MNLLQAVTEAIEDGFALVARRLSGRAVWVRPGRRPRVSCGAWLGAKQPSTEAVAEQWIRWTGREAAWAALLRAGRLDAFRDDVNGPTTADRWRAAIRLLRGGTLQAPWMGEHSLAARLEPGGARAVLSLDGEGILRGDAYDVAAAFCVVAGGWAIRGPIPAWVVGDYDAADAVRA